MVEIKFYAVLPVLAVLGAPALRRLSGPRRRALLIAAACLLWLFVSPLIAPGGPGSRSFLYFARFFAAGVALAALEPLLRPFVWGRRRWATAALVLGAVSLTYVLAAPALLYRVGAPFDAKLGLTFLDLAVMALIAAPLLRQWVDGGCWRALDTRPLHWLGSRSYSFYLVHLLVLYVLGEFIARYVTSYEAMLALLLPTALVVSSLLAELLYRTVELPFMMRKPRSRDAGTSSWREPVSGAGRTPAPEKA